MSPQHTLYSVTCSHCGKHIPPGTRLAYASGISNGAIVAQVPDGHVVTIRADGIVVTACPKTRYPKRT
jgi:hypothetical protein